nr:hypothetical protein Iba_chr01fCG9280 [Ipomoea batatas]
MFIGSCGLWISSARSDKAQDSSQLWSWSDALYFIKFRGSAHDRPTSLRVSFGDFREPGFLSWIENSTLQCADDWNNLLLVLHSRKDVIIFCLMMSWYIKHDARALVPHSSCASARTIPSHELSVVEERETRNLEQRTTAEQRASSRRTGSAGGNCGGLRPRADNRLLQMVVLRGPVFKLFVAVVVCLRSSITVVRVGCRPSSGLQSDVSSTPLLAHAFAQDCPPSGSPYDRGVQALFRPTTACNVVHRDEVASFLQPVWTRAGTWPPICN